MERQSDRTEMVGEPTTDEEGKETTKVREENGTWVGLRTGHRVQEPGEGRGRQEQSLSRRVIGS